MKKEKHVSDIRTGLQVTGQVLRGLQKNCVKVTTWSSCQKATMRSIFEVIVAHCDWDVHLCFGFYQLGFTGFKCNFVMGNKERFLPIFFLTLKKSKVVAMRTTGFCQQTFNLHSSVERSDFICFISSLSLSMYVYVYIYIYIWLYMYVLFSCVTVFFNIGFMMFQFPTRLTVDQIQ